MRVKAPTEKPLTWGDPSNSIDHPAWIEWFQRFFDYYDRVLKWTDPEWSGFGKTVPVNPQTGLMAYADNVNWIPGASAGYYRWSGSSWVFVG